MTIEPIKLLFISGNCLLCWCVQGYFPTFLLSDSGFLILYFIFDTMELSFCAQWMICIYLYASEYIQPDRQPQIVEDDFIFWCIFLSFYQISDVHRCVDLHVSLLLNSLTNILAFCNTCKFYNYSSEVQTVFKLKMMTPPEDLSFYKIVLALWSFCFTTGLSF